MPSDIAVSIDKDGCIGCDHLIDIRRIVQIVRTFQNTGPITADGPGGDLRIRRSGSLSLSLDYLEEVLEYLGTVFCVLDLGMELHPI